MTVCFLLERGSPPRLNPILAEVFALLERCGIAVTARYPEEIATGEQAARDQRAQPR